MTFLSCLHTTSSVNSASQVIKPSSQISMTKNWNLSDKSIETHLQKLSLGMRMGKAPLLFDQNMDILKNSSATLV